MISDEPDEDADGFDDDDLLESCVGGDPSKRQSGSGGAPCVRDWPQSRPGADIGAETLTGFEPG